jgi:serine/threonine-protein kinase
VVKVLLESAEADRDFLARFHNEARVASCLSHPNIVELLDAGELDGVPYLVMEYVPGLSVEQLLARLSSRGERMPWWLACRIAGEIAAALEYAHHTHRLDGQKLHIVHRDVTPNNVLVGVDGSVKLSDFGMAKAVGTPEITVGRPRGRPSYMSPEQIDGGALDGRTDVYILGLTLYEMLVGQRAYPHRGRKLTHESILSSGPTPPSQLLPELPQKLDQIVATATAKSVDGRYQRAGLFCNALLTLLAASGRATPRAELGGLVQRLIDDPPPLPAEAA